MLTLRSRLVRATALKSERRSWPGSTVCSACRTWEMTPVTEISTIQRMSSSGRESIFCAKVEWVSRRQSLEGEARSSRRISSRSEYQSKGRSDESRTRQKGRKRRCSRRSTFEVSLLVRSRSTVTASLDSHHAGPRDSHVFPHRQPARSEVCDFGRRLASAGTSRRVRFVTAFLTPAHRASLRDFLRLVRLYRASPSLLQRWPVSLLPRRRDHRNLSKQLLLLRTS